MNLRQKIYFHLATLGRVGYFPAPGTFASVLATVSVYLFLKFIGVYGFLLPVVSLLVAQLIVAQAEKLFLERDPSEIVIDEVAGVAFTFWGLKLVAWQLFLGLLIFRVLDIFKPFGIKKVEDTTGRWGVVLDDVVAGIMANIVLRIMFSGSSYWIW